VVVGLLSVTDSVGVEVKAVDEVVVVDEIFLEHLLLMQLRFEQHCEE